MKAKIALLTLLCVSISGCATVDLANVGGSSSVSAVSSAQQSKVNVVKRAANKLYTAFTAEGWVARKNRKRVQSTASVLLRGLDKDSVESPLAGYASKPISVIQVHADIKTAQKHVAQTTKAAEVYLAMASDETNLRDELLSLQKALIASREAELVFKAALPESSATDDFVWKEYSAAVDALRDITDAFGDRVRAGYTLTSALQTEVN